MFYKLLYGAAFGYPILRTFLDEVGSYARVKGHSMQPTLNPQDGRHDFIAINRWAKYDLSKGEIVVLISPTDPRDLIVKRVIGLEGEIILPRNYKTYVKVPKGYVWIEGDNRYASVDSNNYGPVPIGLVIGKVVCIIWPPGRMQSLCEPPPLKISYK